VSLHSTFELSRVDCDIDELGGEGDDVVGASRRHVRRQVTGQGVREGRRILKPARHGQSLVRDRVPPF
jgi:hypothetical protein